MTSPLRRVAAVAGGAVAGVLAFAAASLAAALWVRALGSPAAALAAVLLVVAVGAVLPVAAARRPLAGLVAAVVMLALASTLSVQAHSGGVDLLRADPPAMLTQRTGGRNGAVLLAVGAVLGPSLAGLLRRRRERRDPRAS
ncbi:hypothetical protein MHY85_09815 [Cellulomonas sp. ACRRI]|uniref:hypothetical protein n=1 Tax=Cellulomonas sp. ACRRI TaxID=2918188 RepID=UPI001EF2A6A2|nr:hypothetical protein [Cellulomonas sp. ACRRI]MCG7286265.1 hypothetical protein [Cellulomonas sp. ACRRI]